MPIKTSAKIKIDDREWKRIEKILKQFNNAFSAIGLQEGENEVEGVLLAQIGFWNEYGTSRGIPERPWMRGWFDRNIDRIKKMMLFFINKAIDGKISVKSALAQLGEWAQGEIRKEITDLKTPPNAPSTIRQKGSNNPLIDTGLMRGAVRHAESFGKKVKLK